jgi:hydroxyacylglutathione hydrolase
MFIQQLYTKCLAEAAYYIESMGEAAIIDPLRDVEPYLKLAKSRGAIIKYVFETHFHADFVSGHVDLSRETGAPIVIGPTELKPGYPAIIGHDNQLFTVGKIKLKLLHTPGHTLESSCFLLLDEDGKEKALFTGDTLLIGDVGRPDLAQKLDAALTPEKLAGMLYNSLHTRLMPLPDGLLIYPGHGAGSACGKHMSNETTDTLGHQKLVNYALNPALTKQQFTEQVLNGQLPPPSYFPQDVLMNIKGYETLDKVMDHSLVPFKPHAFDWEANNSRALILDTRQAGDFAAGFIPGSLNIGLDGDFAVWAGTMIGNINRPLMLVTVHGCEEEVIRRLARVGFDHVLGFLEGGFTAWLRAGLPVEVIEAIDAKDLAERLELSEPVIVDIRRLNEFEDGHLAKATHFPLAGTGTTELFADKRIKAYVYCAGGYRSMIFISALRNKGYKNLVQVSGGFSAIKNCSRLGQFIVYPGHQPSGSDISSKQPLNQTTL